MFFGSVPMNDVERMMPRAKREQDQPLAHPAAARQRMERCAICKERMPRVTPGHLREHGFTVHRYERLYGERLAPSRSETAIVHTGSVSDPPVETVDAVAERLLDQRVWLSCLANEVGERIMNGPLRQRLQAQLVTMLYQRGKVHGEALAILQPALAELREEWRVRQGGPNGGPTDTDVLLRMVDRVAKLVNDSEDAVQKTIKLALDEQKAAHLFADSIGPTLYQGTGEKLDMPSGLPSGERETIRNLLSLIGKAATDARTIEGSHSVPVQGGGEGGEASPMASTPIADGLAQPDTTSQMTPVAIGDELGHGSSPDRPPGEGGGVGVQPPTRGRGGPRTGSVSDPTSRAVSDPPRRRAPPRGASKAGAPPRPPARGRAR